MAVSKSMSLSPFNIGLERKDKQENIVSEGKGIPKLTADQVKGVMKKKTDIKLGIKLTSTRTIPKNLHYQKHQEAHTNLLSNLKRGNNKFSLTSQ